MKLTTIWTMRGMSLAEKIRRTKDWLARKVAKNLPDMVKFWACMFAIEEVSKTYNGDAMNIKVDRIVKHLGMKAGTV